MNHWLLKTEPGEYSFEDLEGDGLAPWDGVKNAQALIFMRLMSRGDLAFIYHTGKEKQIVGIAEVMKAAYPDPKLDDPKRVVVDVRSKKRVAHPVTLAQIKADAAFADFHLVRMSRLSVMPVPPAIWSKLCKMAGI